MAVVDATTRMLRDLRSGDESAAQQLMPVVYDELRAIAGQYFSRQSDSHTLQPTALVHEAFLKLIDQTNAEWQDRAHFFRVAAKAMRQILIDHARRRNAAKRGGDWKRITLDRADGTPSLERIDLIALDEAMNRLAELDQRQASVVEMRFFGGLNVEETAHALGVSPRTVELDWSMAKAWLSRELSE